MAENKRPWQGIRPLGLVGCLWIGQVGGTTKLYVFPDEMQASFVVIADYTLNTVNDEKATVRKFYYQILLISTTTTGIFLAMGTEKIGLFFSPPKHWNHSLNYFQWYFVENLRHNKVIANLFVDSPTFTSFYTPGLWTWTRGNQAFEGVVPDLWKAPSAPLSLLVVD